MCLPEDFWTMESISSASPWPIHLSSHLLWGTFPNINCFFPRSRYTYTISTTLPLSRFLYISSRNCNKLVRHDLPLVNPCWLLFFMLYSAGSPSYYSWQSSPLHCTMYFSFIHSFGHFYSAPSSPLLLRGAPDYNTDTVSEFHAEAHRQL